jgi:cell shape-determining protein MreC
LVTSGLGGRFPRGYPVGKVVKVEFDPGSPFAHIVARPLAALDRIREVMLLENESGASEPPAPPWTDAPPRRARHERASPHRRLDHGLEPSGGVFVVHHPLAG